MALHRDIFWVGRQWAVTGYGMQAVDQKRRGSYDIEASRLWKDGVLSNLRGEGWINLDDLEKALAVARRYFPEPPRTDSAIAGADAANESAPRPQPAPLTGGLEIRTSGSLAKFVHPWRIRLRR